MQDGIRSALRRMYHEVSEIHGDDRALEELARRVKARRSWVLTDEDAHHRLQQMLRRPRKGRALRSFDVDDLPDAIRVAVRHGAEDLVSRLVFEARTEGELESDERRMVRVGPKRKGDVERRGAA